MTNAISVKDRLKKQAIEDGKTMQDKLVTYGLERTIYRLSVSNYVERFTLKGGIFLYALFNGEYARATMDIDLLAQRIPNDAEEMKKVFNDIFSIECDDALRFDLNTLEVINITEFKEYHGVNVSIMGYLDRTKVPVSIDIGFGDVVYPERVKMEFPVLLDMEVPQVYAYSIYSVIAEKFEAFVSLGLANGRYKDFYDIYDWNGKQVYPEVDEGASGGMTNADCPFLVKVSIPDLNIRKGAGTNTAKTGAYTGVGVFTILEVKDGKGADAGWGKLKSGAGWISLDFCQRV